jgi:general secretion pathway protein F
LSASSSPPFAITLEQLTALNDEMAALVRAGVPLDKGLLDLSGDLPGRLGRLAADLGTRLQSGQSLAQVLEQNRDWPRAYVAVVAAGLRSGRLAAALEGISSLVRRAAELRQLVIVSLVYPLFVVGLAFSLLTFSLRTLFPVMELICEDLEPVGWLYSFVQWLAANRQVWAPLVLLAGLLLLAAVWWRTRGARWVLRDRGWRGGRRGRHASLGQLIYAGRVAAFADNLALLIEYERPLPEALELAGDACGDPRLAEAGRRWAARLMRGEQLDSVRSWDGLPPLVGWIVVRCRDRDRLVRALRRAAESHRRQSQWIGRWLALYLPIWLTVFVGGTATILYTLAILGPWAQVLTRLAEP